MLGSEVDVFSHWYHLVDGLEQSSQAFYTALAEELEARRIPDLHLSRVEFAEGAILSGKREYLRVKRKDHTFDVCAAPFGRGFFVSWWLFAVPGCIGGLPIIGAFFRRDTYYTHDTALMFQSAVHGAVTDTLDRVSAGKGIRALSEFERKPILREFGRR
ncbi:MAG: hypothetical protein HZA52_18865 [Planctomycetes bacterium]|nr:hypothetical protein [Planctomycetota bacterium]